LLGLVGGEEVIDAPAELIAKIAREL
jgi:hypothetical protein